MDLCDLAEIPADNGLERRADDRDLAVFLTAQGVRVYVNACPHQGRSLTFAPDEFLLENTGKLICPHHGACFELVTGACVSGPCKGSRLTAVPVSIEAGKVKLADQALVG